MGAGDEHTGEMQGHYGVLRPTGDSGGMGTKEPCLAPAPWAVFSHSPPGFPAELCSFLLRQRAWWVDGFGLTSPSPCIVSSSFSGPPPMSPPPGSLLGPSQPSRQGPLALGSLLKVAVCLRLTCWLRARGFSGPLRQPGRAPPLRALSQGHLQHRETLTGAGQQDSDVGLSSMERSVHTQRRASSFTRFSPEPQSSEFPCRLRRVQSPGSKTRRRDTSTGSEPCSTRMN
ncbi:PREDICTED: uncharacterized protein LOC106147618 [Chinchilla lanigera]|uniref:uncharacterized protein LOC106147618 n=1 Tax=Chinchilla lanigera TaxID=34839 RepID=UPI000698C97C|nr:PREDICTED: uncharacterized protein LOC106147618 [Chinchilla lanigera]